MDGGRSQFGNFPTAPPAEGAGERPAGPPAWLTNRRLRQEAARLWPQRVNRKGETVLSGLASCRAFSPHRTASDEARPIEVRRSEHGGIALLGTNTCKDRACAECAAPAAVEEQRHIAKVLDVWKRGGETRTVHFGTFTIAHGFGDDFAFLRRGMDEAWSRTFEGRWWARWRSVVGACHFVRRFEATFGANGFHPHYHVLFLSERPFPDADAFAAELLDRFAVNVEAAMGSDHVPWGAHALEFEEVCKRDLASPGRLARYLSKMASELSSATTKQVGNPSVPFGVLAEVRELRCSGANEARRALLESALHNWRAGSKGTTRISWSKALTPVREIARMELERETVEQEEREHVAFIPPQHAPRFLRSASSERFLSAVADGQPLNVLRALWRDASVWRSPVERADALRAYDREQTLWEHGPDGWRLRPPPDLGPVVMVVDATR